MADQGCKAAGQSPRALARAAVCVLHNATTAAVCSMVLYESYAFLPLFPIIFVSAYVLH